MLEWRGLFKTNLIDVAHTVPRGSSPTHGAAFNRSTHHPGFYEVGGAASLEWCTPGSPGGEGEKGKGRQLGGRIEECRDVNRKIPKASGTGN